jgi:hypothetical protein
MSIKDVQGSYGTYINGVVKLAKVMHLNRMQRPISPHMRLTDLFFVGTRHCHCRRRFPTAAAPVVYIFSAQHIACAAHAERHQAVAHQQHSLHPYHQLHIPPRAQYPTTPRVLARAPLTTLHPLRAGTPLLPAPGARTRQASNFPSSGGDSYGTSAYAA